MLKNGQDARTTRREYFYNSGMHPFGEGFVVCIDIMSIVFYNQGKAFEWDEEKNITNQAKHGISFEVGCEVFEEPWISQIDDRKDYGEVRLCALGYLEGFVLLIVYTMRGECTRIISARLASKEERKVLNGFIKTGNTQDPWRDEG